MCLITIATHLLSWHCVICFRYTYTGLGSIALLTAVSVIQRQNAVQTVYLFSLHCPINETEETVSHRWNNNRLTEGEERKKRDKKNNSEGTSPIKKRQVCSVVASFKSSEPGRQAGGTVYCLSRFLCTQRPATSSATPLNHRESLFIGEL